jgi:hypothetical protein
MLESFRGLRKFFWRNTLDSPALHPATNGTVRGAHPTNTFVSFVRFVVNDCSLSVAALR